MTLLRQHTKMKEIDKQIRERGNGAVKLVLKTMNYSCNDLAKRLGVARSTVSDWKLGRNPFRLTVPQVIEFSKILKEAGLTYDDLVKSEKES